MPAKALTSIALKMMQVSNRRRVISISATRSSAQDIAGIDDVPSKAGDSRTAEHADAANEAGPPHFRKRTSNTD
jgi:hypothetical protein